MQPAQDYSSSVVGHVLVFSNPETVTIEAIRVIFGSFVLLFFWHPCFATRKALKRKGKDVGYEGWHSDCHIQSTLPTTVNAAPFVHATRSDTDGVDPDRNIHTSDPLLEEVALLSAQGRDHEMVNLLHKAVSASAQKKCEGNHPKHPSPACFRLAMQRLAASRAPRPLFDALIEAWSLAGLPLDMLTEACCVRYMSRACTIGEASGTAVECALQGHQGFLKQGYVPDLATAECLATACLRAQKPTAVKDLVACLEQHHIPLTPALYAALIAAYSATGAVASGLNVLRRMRLDKNLIEDKTALQLGFKGAVNMCAQNLQPERAVRVYAEGRRLGLEFPQSLLASMIAVSISANRIDLAVPLAAKARAAGVTAKTESIRTVCSLLQNRIASAAILMSTIAVLEGSDQSSPEILQALSPTLGSMWDWSAPVHTSVGVSEQQMGQLIRGLNKITRCLLDNMMVMVPSKKA